MPAAKETRLKKLLVKIRSAPRWLLKSLFEDGASLDDIRELHHRGHIGSSYGDYHGADIFAAEEGSEHHKRLVFVASMMSQNQPVFVHALKIANAPDTGRTASATPDEHGYVKSPVDPTAYRSASDVLSGTRLAADMKQLVAIIKDGTNLVRWTRPIGKSGKPQKSRRSIHAGDWARYEKRSVGTDSEGFPTQGVGEAEHVRSEYYRSKRLGK